MKKLVAKIALLVGSLSFAVLILLVIPAPKTFIPKIWYFMSGFWAAYISVLLIDTVGKILLLQRSRNQSSTNEKSKSKGIDK